MKNTLYCKIHPSYFSYLFEDGEFLYDAIFISNDLLETADRIITNISILQPEHILIEKPYIALSDKTNVRDVIRIQRLAGILLYHFHLTYPDVPVEHINVLTARQLLYQKVRLNLDVQLSEARALLHKTKVMSPLQTLCLHDCLVLRTYHNKKGKTNDE